MVEGDKLTPALASLVAALANARWPTLMFRCNSAALVAAWRTTTEPNRTVDERSEPLRFEAAVTFLATGRPCVPADLDFAFG
jgi:hypothetical protein